jgi:hypothetical protein
MGLVHTAIRSKLGIDKVRKTTVVGMDLKREHIKAGLVCPRTHRHFEGPTGGDPIPEAGSTYFEPSDFEDVLDFDQLAKQLIEEAADSATDSDTDENDPPPAIPAPPLTTILSIRLPVHAIQAALPNITPPRPVPKTAIPLKLLFTFPTDRNSPSAGTDYFWQGGINNLDKEMEAYEILCSSQEGAGEVDMAEGVPTLYITT